MLLIETVSAGGTEISLHIPVPFRVLHEMFQFFGGGGVFLSKVSKTSMRSSRYWGGEYSGAKFLNLHEKFQLLRGVFLSEVSKSSMRSSSSWVGRGFLSKVSKSSMKSFNLGGEYSV